MTEQPTAVTSRWRSSGRRGFSMPDVAGDRGPLLDDFLLTLTGRPRPRVCFVGTASGAVETPLDVRFLG